MLKKAHGYLWLAPRVESAKENEIRAEREQALILACKAHGWELQGFEVDRSLSKRVEERPLLKRLLRNLGEQDLLLVADALDLGRRFRDIYNLMELFRRSESKGSLVALKQDLRINCHEGAEFLMVLSRIPQLHAIRQPEASEGKRSEVSRCNGGACPYGYFIDPETNEYALVDSEAEIVARIFKERARNKSLRQIADALTREQVPTKRGGRWHANTIKSISENPFYTGVYQTHYATLDNHHPLIISAELFYQLNPHLGCDDIAL